MSFDFAQDEVRCRSEVHLILSEVEGYGPSLGRDMLLAFAQSCACHLLLIVYLADVEMVLEARLRGAVRMDRDTVPPARVVERDIVVKTYDVDFAGIVSNIVYIRWLEDLRLAMMEECYPLPRALAEDVAPILLETRISYARPLTIQDRPRGRIWARRMERIRWVLTAEFVSDEFSYATAEQTGLFIRLSTRRPIGIPQPLRARFAPAAPP